MEAFCGIDVACAKGKTLPVAVCVREGSRLTALPLGKEGPPPPRGMGNRLAVDVDIRRQFAERAVSYLSEVERQFGVHISEVAIDAPRRPSTGVRRAAELAMDGQGISCIPTPSDLEFASLPTRIAAHLASGGRETNLPRANQIWMLVGFDLFSALSLCYPCIEVFPNAIVRAIAPGASHKSKADGFQQQLAAVASVAEWNPDELTDCARGSRHDKLDAVMSAWIASLPSARRVAYGDGKLDTIWSVRS